MVRKQFNIRHPQNEVGLATELAMLSDGMQRAFFEAWDAYEKLGVRFVLVGGLAAGSYGEPRATKDIDFLLGDEAFVKSGRIVSFAVKMPLQSDRVAIDPIALPEAPQRWEHLEHGLTNPVFDTTTGRTIRILPPAALAYMKLASPRSKDRGDIVAMVSSGAVDPDELVRMVSGDVELMRALDLVFAELDTVDD